MLRRWPCLLRTERWLGPKLGHMPGTWPLSWHPHPQARTARSLSSAHWPNLTVRFFSPRWILQRQRKGRISPRAGRRCGLRPRTSAPPAPRCAVGLDGPPPPCRCHSQAPRLRMTHSRAGPRSHVLCPLGEARARRTGSPRGRPGAALGSAAPALASFLPLPVC